MAIVCSNWADSFPSIVLAVQPLASMVHSYLPRLPLAQWLLPCLPQALALFLVYQVGHLWILMHIPPYAMAYKSLTTEKPSDST